MTSRARRGLRQDLEAAIGSRRVIWFGIRGEDAEPLLQLKQFEGSFALTGAMRTGSLDPLSNVTFESLSGRRPDLDRYDIDFDESDAAAEFRHRLLRAVSGRCVVMTYRPAGFVSALGFAMAETMTVAGPFKDRQIAFEHKPWVETSLAARGVQTLGWRYVSDVHRERAKRLAAEGPIVLRASRASGGVGIVRADSEDEVDSNWPDQSDEFVGVAPFLGDAVPLNVSGCVFHSGVVRVHPPSVQLIGVASCTDRPFGYCGNDFAAASSLPDRVLGQLNELVVAVGRWLHDERFVGAFGVDALLHNDTVLFMETNARFQGSSWLSAQIAGELDVDDLFLDHLAATLGLEPEDGGLNCVEWAVRQPPLSSVVIHNVGSDHVARSTDITSNSPPGAHVHLVSPPAIQVEPGGVLARLTVPQSVTQTGFELDDAAAAAVEAVARSYAVVERRR